ncbi:MAG: Xaa-Pro peptidase family protein [Christensenellaceae bacterium]
MRTDSIKKLDCADAYLLTSKQNVTYATGFSGDSSQVLITKKDIVFFTDSRYTAQAKKEISGIQILESNSDRMEQIAKIIKSENIKVIGIEQSSVTVEKFEEYKKYFGGLSYTDISNDLLILRMIKTEDEIKKIKIAANANEVVLKEIVKYIKVGVSEFDVRAELVYQINKQKMDNAFEPIVAAGINSALPHATVSDYVIQDGDFLTLDFGCKYFSYCSDITRTFGVGNVDEKSKKIYDIVKTAQMLGVQAAKIGEKSKNIDAIVRSYIKDCGYGAYYNHGTGHGVGLEIHELPVINTRADFTIQENMVFTVEPGIYIEGFGGVRIEDMLLAGEGSVYQFTKELILL